MGDSPYTALAGSSSQSQGYHEGFVSTAAIESQQVRVNKYETTLPLRVDLLSALAYSLGPISGVILLILETKNDYVRFHAWQSSLIFSFMVLMHFFWMFISSVISWLLFVVDLGLIGWLSYQAYINGDTLSRYELPYIGQIASRWVDTE
ncbi:hypothetical protein SmJEL517_g05678 [Synchytrium microbalum]|uniref:Uncharacterized protein n=1 Tax=Synchytrium microbalum TaxID=1806994 RepID=A0A507BZV6_9FUNG|nr:uncharacterized protein SmJEL517_g05678 [Synchytrium microbalum]TPX30865.1 hypothetical protein SmJEL517_g05678 [Synchytrium microbalum]